MSNPVQAVKAAGVGEASSAEEASGTTPGAEATAGAEEETPSSLDERTVESLSQGPLI